MRDLDKKSYPSENQIRELWEWCGWTQDTRGWWYEPNTEHYIVNRYWEDYSNQPKLDLNNLFKYAVPQLTELGYQTNLKNIRDGWNCMLYDYGDTSPKRIEANEYDPALALFWAIWKVIHERN